MNQQDESVHALSGAYAVDAVDDEERAAFEEHLARCETCQQEVASLREAAVQMSLPEQVTPPEALRAAVLSGIAQVRPLPPQPQDETAGTSSTSHENQHDPRPGSDDDAERPAASTGAPVVGLRDRARRWGTRSRVAVAAVAAAVVAVIGAGVVTQPWAEDSPTGYVLAQRVLDAPDAASVTEDFPDGSQATVTRSVAEGRAVLETRDMPEPPADQVFELWLMDDQGEAVPAGLMTSAGDTTVVLDGDATEASAVAITTEPEGGSEQPTSEPFAVFDLDGATA